MSERTRGPWRANGKRIERYRRGDENTKPRWVTLKPNEADLLLQAAAPELLEAVMLLLGAYDAFNRDRGLSPMEVERLKFASRAVAKAETGNSELNFNESLKPKGKPDATD